MNTSYQITVKDADGNAVEVKNNSMTVKVPMSEQLKGYKYYQVVYLGDELEYYDAKVEGDNLVVELTHLSLYAILGSNTPFETSQKIADTTSPQTSDNSNMTLWITVMLFSCGGVIGTTVYSKRKRQQAK